ncbi:hypothetical protein M0R45_020348 [Rubus argutus]|uniref:Uncharacterized protein n=2 Tax=Rubus argutus TaxID=59490 RepID=A0AAW1XA76_RUBAR
MSKLKHLGAEFYGYNDDAGVGTSKQTRIMSLFPALKTLSIEFCSELIEWKEAPMMSNGGKVLVFPCLEELSLRDCPELRNAPSHFPCLKKLEIDGMGHKMPMENIVSTPELTTLTDVEIYSVKGLTCVPEEMLMKNKNLTSLWIRNCADLTCIAPNVFGCCTSLQSLSIRYCEKVRDLADGLDTLPLLEELYVDECPSLELIQITQGMESLRKVEIKNCGGLSIPPSGLEFCTSLQELTVWDCPLLPSISFTRVLQRLRIMDCSELTSISMSSHQRGESEEEEIFPSLLKELRIEDCHSLESIIPANLQGFTCLCDLRIRNCGKLKYLPTGLHCLTSLKELRIGGLWEELDSFPDFQLPPNSQLDRLRLVGWPKLKCLPQIHHLTCLTILKIYNFGGLESLPEWLGNLESLEKLFLDHCENLKYLPTLEAMQRLTNLKTLYIWRCPLLEERCLTNGPEWPKISHFGGYST